MWSDPSSNMAYGNQWMNPAFYKNMNNEQGRRTQIIFTNLGYVIEV